MYERQSYTYSVDIFARFFLAKKPSLYTTGPKFREILGVQELKYACEIQNCS